MKFWGVKNDSARAARWLRQVGFQPPLPVRRRPRRERWDRVSLFDVVQPSPVQMLLEDLRSIVTWIEQDEPSVSACVDALIRVIARLVMP